MRLSMPRPALFQRLIQSIFLGYCLFIGYRFSHFVLWITGQSEISVPRPPSVEAFLPIAALMGLRRLLQSGTWDMVHPAGLVIFLAALLMALLLRKGFWGPVCSVGLISGLLNSCTYIGSALSTYVIAVITDHFGWSATLLIWLMRRGEATRTSALLLAVPPLSAVQAWLIFGETLSPVQLLGFAVAIAGVALARR